MSTQLRFLKTNMNYRRENNQQTVFPAKNFIRIINNFVVRSKKLSISLQAWTQTLGYLLTSLVIFTICIEMQSDVIKL